MKQTHLQRDKNNEWPLFPVTNTIFFYAPFVYTFFFFSNCLALWLTQRRWNQQQPSRSTHTTIPPWTHKPSHIVAFHIKKQLSTVAVNFAECVTFTHMRTQTHTHDIARKGKKCVRNRFVECEVGQGHLWVGEWDGGKKRGKPKPWAGEWSNRCLLDQK